MTTVEYQVGAGADDGSKYGTTFDAGRGDIRCADYISRDYDAWFRFTGVTIPDGATIDAAYLKVQSWGNYSGYEWVISAEDAANPTAPSSVADYDGRTITTATVTDSTSLSAGWNNLGSIVGIIEELMASNSYAAGSAMQFFLKNNTASGVGVLLYGYENAAANAVILHIEYTEGGGGCTTTVTVVDTETITVVVQE